MHDHDQLLAAITALADAARRDHDDHHAGAFTWCAWCTEPRDG